jgi:hypothetical protein
MKTLAKKLACFLLLAAALTGCIAEGETKFGDVGELCFADSDCREALLCEQGACLDPLASANNGTNNGANNGTNNGANNGVNNGVNNGANNGGGCDPDSDPQCVCLDAEGFLCDGPDAECVCEEAPPTMGLSCADLCGYLEDCGIEGGRACQGECSNAVEPYNQAEQQQIFSCIRSLSCDEVFNGAELCFGPAGGDGGAEPSPGDRAAACDELAVIVKEEYGCDFDVYEGCLRASELYNDELFYSVYECLETDNCQDLRQCIARWEDI